MERDSRLPTGEWNGFYLEPHHSKKGWMHLYLSFDNGKIAGEGTDHVGPWTASGSYDLESGICSWIKQYVRKHQVAYQGIVGQHGIQGHWNILHISDEFHIWPKSMGQLNEMYLQQELNLPFPSIPLGRVPAESEFV
jgi:hypothetical protein